jgi:hypothetical protein
MKAGHKFLLGASLIVASVGFLIAQGVKETGVYFLTPTELAAKTTADPTSTTSGSRWAPRWCRADPPRPFEPAGGLRGERRRATLPGHLPRLVPDTFTDANDIEVIVEGRLAATGCSAPPKCSPSAARGTKPPTNKRRPDRS